MSILSVLALIYRSGTGWYDQALSECVLEELDFGTPKQDEVLEKAKKKIQYWWCVDGGAQRIAKLMEGKIKQKVQFDSQVEAISFLGSRMLLYL